MKKIIIILTFFTGIFSTFSQNLKKLEDNNGFRKIKLNSNIKDYYDADGYYDFVKRDSTNQEYFGNLNFDYIYANKDYDKIGNSKISSIYVNTYNDVIYEIRIYLEPNSEIVELTRMAYGKPTWNLNLKSNFDMGWTTENHIICHLMYYEYQKITQLSYENTELAKKAGLELYKNEQNKALKEF